MTIFKDFSHMLKIFYGSQTPEAIEKQNRHSDFIRTKHFNPHFEERVRKIFSVFPDFKKVPETKQNKTVDFISEENKLVVEVTSINSHRNKDGSYKKFGPRHYIKKFNKIFRHLKEKGDFLGYKKIVAFSFCSKMDVILQDIIKQEFFNAEFLFQTNFLKEDLLGLLYLPHHTSISKQKDIFVLKNKNSGNYLEKIFKSHACDVIYLDKN